MAARATHASAPAVRIRGLRKTYASTVALDGVDLELAPGELRGLLGPNGAGKTTLLRLLFGLARPDAGAVEVAGRLGGFVEDPTFYPYLSARRNLELLADLDGFSRGDVPALLERVGLAARAEDRVAGFSTGMRQRLGIAAALLHRPTVLALDEPTSGLDPAGMRDTATLLRELADAGTAVLISSHLIGELEELCDSYTILGAGAVLWSGAAEAVSRQPRRASPLQDLYFSITG